MYNMYNEAPTLKNHLVKLQSAPGPQAPIRKSDIPDPAKTTQCTRSATQDEVLDIWKNKHTSPYSKALGQGFSIPAHLMNIINQAVGACSQFQISCRAPAGCFFFGWL